MVGSRGTGADHVMNTVAELSRTTQRSSTGSSACLSSRVLALRVCTALARVRLKSFEIPTFLWGPSSIIYLPCPMLLFFTKKTNHTQTQTHTHMQSVKNSSALATTESVFNGWLLF